MKLACYQYKIPFKEPFVTGSQTFEHREGMILELEKEGVRVYGEAAPLPGFTSYSVKDIADHFGRLRANLLSIFREDLKFEKLQSLYETCRPPPSLAFALDTLAYKLAARQQKAKTADLLFEHSHPSISLNGVVSSSAPDAMLKSSERLIRKGFKTLKLKTGFKFERLPEVLKYIRSSHPGIALRIDANGSWNLQEAIRNVKMLEQFDIEYCEEPLAEVNGKHLKTLTNESAVPIALDESFSSLSEPDLLLPYISVIILKPMVIGNFSKLFATKHLADYHDIKTVFTSSLESGIGRMMTAILASGLGSPHVAHGLATGSLLTIDVWDDGTYIDNGRFTLPDHIELGEEHEPDLSKIPLRKLEL